MSEPAGLVPTPRYRRILRDAEEIARGLSHGYVGVEHLFLAVIRDRDAVPTQVLSESADLGQLETALLALLDSDGYRAGPANIVVPGAG
jgi:ATP-dependent Clp protease ATP-binding subunit ClpA